MPLAFIRGATIHAGGFQFSVSDREKRVSGCPMPLVKAMFTLISGGKLASACSCKMRFYSLTHFIGWFLPMQSAQIAHDMLLSLHWI
ncbi:hypothetical protein [Parasphingorhabdus sp.]|jgi:hypothetical protein|uniref:hypothetical protein n=1 Tax=Parasphingorhabdus sp. TaxID=2709688 RepID=UPI003BB07B8D